ncbi:MAG: hypothetical protein KDD65_05420 [Bacteroidetes bacterium]|nr:hypothetical protein [Bacteroidota bacterium]
MLRFNHSKTDRKPLPGPIDEKGGILAAAVRRLLGTPAAASGFGETATPRSGGRDTLRESWLRFVDGIGQPPVGDDKANNPLLIGEELAAFLRNEFRASESFDKGFEHEMRSALNEAVQGLAALSTQTKLARGEMNDTLNRVQDAGTVTTAELEQLINEVRGQIRTLDEFASEQRRRSNARLANLRMTLLPTNGNRETTLTHVSASGDVIRRFEAYRNAAHLLGESLTAVRIVGTIGAESVQRIQRVFRRDADLLVRVAENEVLALLIDTPAEALSTLLVPICDLPETTVYLGSIETASKSSLPDVQEMELFRPR